MKDIVIIGAGGLGLEIAWLVEEINDDHKNWNLLGFLDNDPALIGTEILGYPVLGGDDDAVKFKSAHFALGVGDPYLRRKLADKINPVAAGWANLYSPTVRVHRSHKMGTGVIVGRYTDFTVNCEIGDFAMLNIHAVLGHSVSIGKFTLVDPNVTINGEGKIGDYCLIGANAFVRDVTIGDGVTVGAGSVVIKDVEPHCVVAGVPAKVIKMGRPGHTLTKTERAE